MNITLTVQLSEASMALISDLLRAVERINQPWAPIETTVAAVPMVGPLTTSTESCEPCETEQPSSKPKRKRARKAEAAEPAIDRAEIKSLVLRTEGGVEKLRAFVKAHNVQKLTDLSDDLCREFKRQLEEINQ